MPGARRMLLQILTSACQSDGFALALSPGFFRFYAHIGILQALEEADCLKVSHVTGSSAGALVGAFLAAGKLTRLDFRTKGCALYTATSSSDYEGMKPSEMCAPVFAIKREDMWDMGGNMFLGLLKGQSFQSLLEAHLPYQMIEGTTLHPKNTAESVEHFICLM